MRELNSMSPVIFKPELETGKLASKKANDCIVNLKTLYSSDYSTFLQIKHIGIQMPRVHYIHFHYQVPEQLFQNLTSHLNHHYLYPKPKSFMIYNKTSKSTLTVMALEYVYAH
jgi:hypothetical protein